MTREEAKYLLIDAACYVGYVYIFEFFIYKKNEKK